MLRCAALCCAALCGGSSVSGRARSDRDDFSINPPLHPRSAFFLLASSPFTSRAGSMDVEMSSGDGSSQAQINSQLQDQTQPSSTNMSATPTPPAPTPSVAASSMGGQMSFRRYVATFRSAHRQPMLCDEDEGV